MPSGGLPKPGEILRELLFEAETRVPIRPALDELARVLEGRAGAILRAHLHHAVCAFGHLEHPTPLAHEERRRLFDVHVLARGAGHHRHERVPVIRRTNVDRVHIFVRQQLAKIGVSRRAGAGHFRRRLQPPAMHIAHRGDLCIRLLQDCREMKAPDEPESDQAHMDALIRTGDLGIRSRAERSSRSGKGGFLDEGATVHEGRCWGARTILSNPVNHLGKAFPAPAQSRLHSTFLGRDRRQRRLRAPLPGGQRPYTSQPGMSEERAPPQVPVQKGTYKPSQIRRIRPISQSSSQPKHESTGPDPGVRASRPRAPRIYRCFFPFSRALPPLLPPPPLLLRPRFRLLLPLLRRSDRRLCPLGEGYRRFWRLRIKTAPPPKGGIVFVGSSTIVRWKTLSQDFPGLQIINRGFGGNEIEDCTHFADRTIFPYEPRTIFLRAGGNDIHSGKSPERVFADFKEFVATIRGKLPSAEIVYISMSPSIARLLEAPQNKAANEMIAQYCRENPKLKYIERRMTCRLAPMDSRARNFSSRISAHFSPEGYKLLAERVRPFLPKP